MPYIIYNKIYIVRASPGLYLSVYTYNNNTIYVYVHNIIPFEEHRRLLFAR